MLNKIIVNQYNLWLVIFVALGTISTAYGLAVIGSTVGQPNFYTYFNLATAGEPGYDHTTNIIGALNGVNSAGAIAGCIFQAWAADYYGRKRTLQIGCVILIVGGALCAGAYDMAMFLVGRFVAGVGAGILACIVPIYQAEVSTPETRGAMVVSYSTPRGSGATEVPALVVYARNLLTTNTVCYRNCTSSRLPDHTVRPLSTMLSVPPFCHDRLTSHRCTLWATVLPAGSDTHATS